ncbi:maestro heat-like repeat-containing protein family member 7 isoform X2 [Paroedura picta]
MEEDQKHLATANEESAGVQMAQQSTLMSRNIVFEPHLSQMTSEESVDAYGMMLYDGQVKHERQLRAAPGTAALNEMCQSGSPTSGSDLSGSDQEDYQHGSPKLELAKQITAEIKGLPLNSIDFQGTILRCQGMQLVKDLSKAKTFHQTEKELLIAIIASIFSLFPIDTLQCQNGEKSNAEALYNQNVEALEAMLRSLLLQRPCSTELLVLLECVAPWMTSGLGYERARAVKIYVFLLKFAATYPAFHVPHTFPKLGILIGQLSQCFNDPEIEIGYQAMEGMCFLYSLMQHQKGIEKDTDLLEAKQHQMLQEKLDFYDPIKPCQNITKILKEFGPFLTSIQMTELLLTAIGYLRETRIITYIASYATTSVILEHYKHKLYNQVPEIVHKIHQQLGSIHQFQGRQIMLTVISSLAHSYMAEVCGALLRCPFPMDRCASDMWRALTKTGSNFDLMVLVNILLKKLQINPNLTGNYITPLAAAAAFCKLLSLPKCSDVAFNIYPRLLMTLLVQMHYNIRHKVIRSPVFLDETESVRYIVKALKTLFLAVGCYCEFLFTEKDGLWKQLTSYEDHHRGVGMLARVLMQCTCCDRLRILYLLVPFLERGDEEHQITAMAFFIELLYMPEAKRLPDKYSLNRLNRGLVNTNPVIRALCIKGLVKMEDWPGKEIKILLPAMIKGLSGMDGRLYVETVTEIDKILAGSEGADYISSIIQSLQELFSHERESVRASAILLFGKMVKIAKKGNEMTIKYQILENLVPLLLHHQEDNPEIIENCKYSLEECFRFLGYKMPKQVAIGKAWHENEAVLDETCRCLVQKHEGNLQRFLYQGLFHTESSILSIRKASVMFLGFLVLHMDYRAGEIELNVIINSLECLMHDSEESVCIAAAQAHERVSAVLSKQEHGPHDSNMTAASEKPMRNARHHSATATGSGSANLFAVIGLWKSANKN